MKLKSYLRGLGVGIVVTTIILVIAFKGRNKTMTDAEVRSRAYQLGMVETSMYGNSNEIPNEKDDNNLEKKNNEESSGEGLLAEENTEITEETVGNSGMKETTVYWEMPLAENESITFEIETTTGQESTIVSEVTESETATEVESVTQMQVAVDEVEVVFENITSADKASRLLYEAGIIQNVSDFNAYLSQNDYATKISEGTFKFRIGMTYEEIARIITRQNLY